MRKKTIFIDESGTKEIEDEDQNIYTLCGVIVNNNHIDSINSEMKNLKNSVFGTEDVELKSNWLRNKKERECRYLKKYFLTDQKLDAFVSFFYSWINKLDIRLIGSSINKKVLKSKYKNPFNPNPLSYELLTQRLANLCHYDKVGIEIIFDDMPIGKTAAGNTWKDLLIKKHNKLKENPKTVLTKNWDKPMNYNCLSNEIKFVDSAQNNFIQIADLCAYNIRRQSEKYWETDTENVVYWGYKQIYRIIHSNPENIKERFGYGVICFPLL